MRSAQPARDARDWTSPSTELLILDLDGTLHTDRALIDGLHEAFVAYVSSATGWSAAQTTARLTEHRQRSAADDAVPAGEFAFLASVGVDLDGWLDTAERAVGLAGRVALNDGLIQAIGQAHAGRTIAVTTNSPWSLARVVLDRLRVTPHTDLLACPRHPAPAVPFPRGGKPSAALYREILRHFGSTPERALVIGDRYEIDIAPGIALGIESVLVDEERSLTDVLLALGRFELER